MSACDELHAGFREARDDGYGSSAGFRTVRFGAGQQFAAAEEADPLGRRPGGFRRGAAVILIAGRSDVCATLVTASSARISNSTAAWPVRALAVTPNTSAPHRRTRLRVVGARAAPFPGTSRQHWRPRQEAPALRSRRWNDSRELAERAVRGKRSTRESGSATFQAR